MNRNTKKYKYKLTEEQLVTLESLDSCVVCGEAATDIDHDHVTGRVRGVLCRGCNLALGHAKEGPERLRALAMYLEAQEYDNG